MKYLLAFLWMVFVTLTFNSANAYYSCSEYGSMAYSSGDWYCQCASWYKMGTVLGRKYCVSWATYCYDNYGINSEYNYLASSCKCRSWYEIGKDIFGNQTCVKEKSCTDLYGYGAKENYNWTCSCRFWYKFENTYSGQQCKMQFCSLNSTFNDSTKQCECNDWYIQDTTYSSFTCREKAYSTYAYIDNIIDSLVSVIYYDPYWAIQSKDIAVSTCFGLSSKLIWQKWVINLLYDKALNIGDYFILPPDFETSCYVLSVKNTPDKPSCLDTINGYLWTDNKCYCNAGYTFDTSLNSCKKVTNTPVKCKKWELKRNGKCVSAKTLK